MGVSGSWFIITPIYKPCYISKNINKLRNLIIFVREAAWICSTSSTAQGAGGSFKIKRKPIERLFVANHVWQSEATDGSINYLPIDLSAYLSINLSTLVGWLGSQFSWLISLLNS